MKKNTESFVVDAEKCSRIAGNMISTLFNKKLTVPETIAVAHNFHVYFQLLLDDAKIAVKVSNFEGRC